MSHPVYYETDACVVCGKTTEMVLELGPYEKWREGTHVQDAFPDMSVDDRELLISGTHAPCWDKLMGEVPSE